VGLTNAVAQGDGVDFKRRSTARDHPLLDLAGQVLEVNVAGMNFAPGVDDADEGLF